MRGHRGLVLIISIMMLAALTISSVNQAIIFASEPSADMYGVSFATGETIPDERSANTLPIRLGESEKQHRILYLSNSTTPLSIAEHMAELADVDTIKSVVSYLSSFDNRYTGTQGSLGTISYIHEFFRLNCSIQNVFFDNFTFNDQGALVEASNIIAKINAVKPTEKTVLVTAHHDSIGYQYPFNIYNIGARGADDDASGVGVVLETARVLSMFKDYLRYNVLFIVFAAEEGNKTLDPDFMCQGSTHWVSTDHIGVNKLSDVVGAVNLDGVAYKNGGLMGIFHHEGGSTVASNVSSVASLFNIPTKDEGEPRRDTYLKPVRCRTEDPFDKARLPAVTLSNHYANPFTHTNLDTVSYLDFNLACNFTKIVVSYLYLTGGVLPKSEETYAANWNSVINTSGRFALNESNYIDVNFNPNLIDDYDLMILDPSLNGMTTNHLLSIISACSRLGKKLPILSLGKVNSDLLRALNLTEIKCMERNSSHNELVAYVGSSIADVSSHPVYNSPNSVSLAFENSTHLTYTVLGEQLRDNFYYLIRNDTKRCPQLLPLGFTPHLSQLWSWLAVFHDDRWRCGPVAFIGVNNGSTMTYVAQNIAENMICWLLNGSTTTPTVRVSDRNPFVGSHITIEVVVRNSLTWEANSSVPIDINVVSPSGNMLLTETLVTDNNGVAQSGSVLIREIGDHQVIVSTNLGGAGVTRTTITFRSNSRIIIHLDNNGTHITQGESTSVELGLTYVPPMSEEMILEVNGKPLLSNVSIQKTLNHGYNNMTFTITAQETIRTGEYTLIFVAMPSTMEYIACKEPMKIIVTPAYEVNIIEAPNTIDQLATSQLLVQIKSYRSVPVDCSLRIDSYKIMLTGEVSLSISSGETKQIVLPIKEASSSPYSWGEGEVKISVVRNGIAVVESTSITVLVSLSPTNLALGYVLPAVLPVAIFLERSKKTKAKLAASGALIGGYMFFTIGLMISQSLFMMVPLSMLVVGSYMGTTLMKRVYDPPLPKGYIWLVPSKADQGSVGFDATGSRNTTSTSNLRLQGFGFAGVDKLRELYNVEKYREVVPAAYMLVADVLSDLLAIITNTAQPDIVKAKLIMRDGSRGTLAKLLKQLKQRHIAVPCEANLSALEELHQKYNKLSNSPNSDQSRSAARYMAQKSIELTAGFIIQNCGEGLSVRM